MRTPFRFCCFRFPLFWLELSFQIPSTWITKHRQTKEVFSTTSHMTPSSILICSCHYVDLTSTSPQAKTYHNCEFGWLRKPQNTHQPLIRSNSQPLIINLPIHSIHCVNLVVTSGSQLWDRVTPKTTKKKRKNFVSVHLVKSHPLIVLAAGMCGWYQHDIVCWCQRFSCGWASAHW